MPPLFAEELPTKIMNPHRNTRLHSAVPGCKRLIQALAAILLSAAAFAVPSSAAPAHWVATWAASPSLAPDNARVMARNHFIIHDATLREIVHTSLGGPEVRVRFATTFGTESVHIAAASILTPSGTLRPLTFAGKSSFTMPPNAVVVTDPVALDVPADSDLAINLYLQGTVNAASIHYVASQISYIAPGDQTGSKAWPRKGDGIAFPRWAFLAGVDVAAPASAATIVAFGDSITDGVHSTVNANHRWPNDLFRRLQSAGRKHLSVVDAGISGNRLITDAARSSGVSALARLDRDVLTQPGVRYIIVLEGINDIGHAAPGSLTSADLIAGLAQLAERAHELGLKIYGATLTPDGGAKRGYYTAETEKIREGYNAWIRSNKLLDGYVDFDRVTRDPAHPKYFLPAYNSGDDLHPNDAGYQAMAAAIPLSFFAQ